MSKTKVLFLLFLLLSTLLSSAYLFLPAHFQSLDNRVRDFYFKFRGPEKTSEQIVIIDIDEKSIKALGQWPWERDKIAQILNNLTANGAGIIGLDIVFAEADKTSPKKLAKQWGVDSENFPDYDLILSQTIKNTPTILSYVFDFSETNTKKAPHVPSVFIEKNKTTTEFLPQAKGVLTNINIIQNAGYSSGFMNSIPDESGIIRSTPLMIKYDDMIYTSLAFEMYRIVSNSKKVLISYSEVGVENVLVGKNSVKTDRFGKLYLNFRGAFRSFKYLSAIDVYNNHVKKEAIEGKIVLIGTSAYGLMDLRSTPMDSVIPGVEIQANALDNLLNQDMLIKLPFSEFIDLSIIIFILFLVLFIYSRLSLISLFIFFALSLIAILYINYYVLFSHYIILNSIFPIFSMILSLMSLLAVNYIYEFRQKEMIKNSFSKKVSKQVMDDLLSNPSNTNLKAKEVQATIYFSDIRDFTTISERLESPKRITDFLNFYLNIMVKSIEKNHGTIDKFIGDAIMAYWNAPIEIDNHPDLAVLTAIEQINKRDELNKTLTTKFNFNMDYGIGINTGKVVVGEVGSHGRSDYTIIGDSVNLASRLESLCKVYKVRLVISEYTKIKLKKEYVIQLLDIVKVKGKQESVKIYEVLSQGKATQEKELELSEYTTAHSLYMQANFKEAEAIFAKLYDKYEKYLYELYSLRCKKLFDEDIEHFDGLFEFTAK